MSGKLKYKPGDIILINTKMFNNMYKSCPTKGYRKIKKEMFCIDEYRSFDHFECKNCPIEHSCADVVGYGTKHVYYLKNSEGPVICPHQILRKATKREEFLYKIYGRKALVKGEKK